MFTELWEELCDLSVFTDSLRGWLSNLSVQRVIVLIMMVFMLVGAVDRLRGNKKGYGARFEEGFMAMGPLALAMAGVIAAAPVLSLVLRPVLSPLFTLLGADPGMFAGSLLACDMGGYALSKSLAGSEALGNFAGLILGATMGPTLVFTIPVALSVAEQRDRPFLGAGVLAGMITIPLGCLVGGLAMNLTPFHLTLPEILINLLPVTLLAALLAAALWFFPERTVRVFGGFGAGVTAVITALTALAVLQYETGLRLPLLRLMVEPDSAGAIPLETGLLVCGQIGCVLIGAFPMVEWIRRTFGKPLGALGRALGINEAAGTGLVANLANSVAVFAALKDMDPKGKLLNVAFAVSASFVFGDHLGFAAGVEPEMILPMILCKLTAGLTALLAANLLAPRLLRRIAPAAAEPSPVPEP